MKKPIYLDYSATTPVDPRVAEKLCRYLTLDGEFGNPASRSHQFGWHAEEAVEQARGHVASLIAADPKEIVWTSGATESDNLAIKGAAHIYSGKGKHIINGRCQPTIEQGARPGGQHQGLAGAGAGSPGNILVHRLARSTDCFIRTG